MVRRVDSRVRGVRSLPGRSVLIFVCHYHRAPRWACREAGLGWIRSDGLDLRSAPLMRVIASVRAAPLVRVIINSQSNSLHVRVFGDQCV